jgi:hypothetical protein
MTWQVEELLEPRALEGHEPKENCRWPSTRDFEIEGDRYSLLSYSKGGGNRAAKIPAIGREPR